MVIFLTEALLSEKYDSLRVSQLYEINVESSKASEAISYITLKIF